MYFVQPNLYLLKGDFYDRLSKNLISWQKLYNPFLHFLLINSLKVDKKLDVVCFP